jgi:hypothetical protein
MSQFLVVGTVLKNWEDGNMVVHPFRLGEAVIEQSQKQQNFHIFKRKHLLETALDWKAKMALTPSIKTAYISEKVGVTDGRVRQIFRLTKLHQNIQRAILALPPREAKKRFPEKLLRKWTPLDHEEQLSQFSALIR